MAFDQVEILSAIGIGAEIFGFILMIKYYGKKPTDRDWTNWKTRNLVNKGIKKIGEDDQTEMEFEKAPLGYREPVHRGFRRFWNYKTKYIPLGFVIGGLFLQGVQLIFD